MVQSFKKSLNGRSFKNWFKSFGANSNFFKLCTLLWFYFIKGKLPVKCILPNFLILQFFMDPDGHDAVNFIKKLSWTSLQSFFCRKMSKKL